MPSDRIGAECRLATPNIRIAAYKITLAEVADLSQGFDPERLGRTLERMGLCVARQIARIDKKVQPSWKLADRLITAGLRGILFRRYVMLAAPTW